MRVAGGGVSGSICWPGQDHVCLNVGPESHVLQAEGKRPGRSWGWEPQRPQVQTWQFLVLSDVHLARRVTLRTETASPLSFGHRDPVLAPIVVDPLAAAPAKVGGFTSRVGLPQASPLGLGHCP